MRPNADERKETAYDTDAKVEPSDWALLRELCSEWEGVLSENQIKHIIRKRDENGLSRFVAKPGKNLIINRRGFAHVVTRAR